MILDCLQGSLHFGGCLFLVLGTCEQLHLFMGRYRHFFPGYVNWSDVLNCHRVGIGIVLGNSAQQKGYAIGRPAEGTEIF